MSPFQQYATLLIAIWAVAVAVRFRTSASALLGGLFAIGALTAAAVAHGDVTVQDLGLGPPPSWPVTMAIAVAGLAVMLAYSPVADWLATQWAKEPPTLGAFRALQQSTSKLILGIVAAWILGGFLEELVARGIVLQAVEKFLSGFVAPPIAAAAAIAVAGVGAGMLHLYQGPRAVIIVTQLSILLGVLFLVSGANLWSVVLCHGLYDTIAFVRFALKKSKYSNIDGDAPHNPARHDEEGPGHG